MRQSPPLLIHHAAEGAHTYPPGSLAALRACLEAGARAVEIDIAPLADGSFLLWHDVRLEHGTTGTGLVAQQTSRQVQGVFYLRNGVPTAEKLGFLHQALEMVDAYPALQELQLDLKPYARLADAHFDYLQRHLPPVWQRTRITTVADWELWRVAEKLPGLPLGFDPLAYLDYSTPAEGERPGQRAEPPWRRGAFGYWDDHPLALMRWGPVRDYLELRAQLLIRLAPASVVWYLHDTLLEQALADGFDWIAYLHGQGHQVDAWTLDPGQEGAVALVRRLIEAGVDRLTTTNAPVLAAALGGGVVY